MDVMRNAISKGDLNEVQRLISSGFSINSVDSNKRTALHLAVWSNQTAIVKCLLQAKAHPKAAAADLFLPIHFAAPKAGIDVQVIKLLVKADPSTLRSRINGKGRSTPLMLAVKKGLQQNIDMLISLGAVVDDEVLAIATSPETRQFVLETQQRYELEREEKKKQKNDRYNNINNNNKGDNNDNIGQIENESDEGDDDNVDATKTTTTTTSSPAVAATTVDPGKKRKLEAADEQKYEET